MARVFITGSSDGIGLLAAQNLVKQGHRVVLHARNEKRASDAKTGCPGAEGCLIADLSSINETKRLADEANKQFGTFETVIHNAGLGYRGPFQKTEDGIAAVFAVNSLAPYILTCLMNRPKNLVYLSSGLHSGGDGSLHDVTWATGRAWDGFQAYSDSKLHDVMLALAVARHWPDCTSNAVNPGWVATKMGGSGAPESLQKAVETQVWIATTKDKVPTGKYFKHKTASNPQRSASDAKKQDEFLKICEQVSGVPFPR